MTNPARIDRAPRADHRRAWTSVRLRRRLRSDPHIVLALALAVPTVIVDVLDQGPNELGIAEEIRTAFAEQWFRGASGERLSATVSAGCAELGPDDGLGELLGACDVGLAMAKAAGRNQVVAA